MFIREITMIELISGKRYENVVGIVQPYHS